MPTAERLSVERDVRRTHLVDEFVSASMAVRAASLEAMFARATRSDYEDTEEFL